MFPHFHLPVVQPSPNLPRPVPAGCIAWQWPCWMKPKRISPQWWVYGEIHHVKIWVKIHEKKVINMMKYGEHLKNLDHHVSCLESHAGEMCFFWCGGPGKSLPTGLSGPDARDLRAVLVLVGWNAGGVMNPGRCIALPPQAVVRRYCLGRSQLDGHSNHLGEKNFRRRWMDQKDVSST